MLTFYEFTEEDLRSNQHGFISQGQREFLKGYADSLIRSHRGGWPVMIFFLLLGGGLILAMNLSNESTRRAFFATPGILIALCMTFPVVLGIYGLGAIFARRRSRDFEEAVLSVAEGEIEWDEESSSVGPVHFLYVGPTEFKFAENFNAVFPAGRRGRIFYCESSGIKLILSHELLSA